MKTAWKVGIGILVTASVSFVTGWRLASSRKNNVKVDPPIDELEAARQQLRKRTAYEMAHAEYGRQLKNLTEADYEKLEQVYKDAGFALGTLNALRAARNKAEREICPPLAGRDRLQDRPREQEQSQTHRYRIVGPRHVHGNKPATTAVQ